MEKLSHAYIVYSPSEAEGNAFARELAAKMLCSSDGLRPCGICRDCRKIKNGIHPDVTVISRLEDENGIKKGGITIDQIRQMRASAHILPNEARGRVFVIYEADTMNERAQNAALKLFEEPPAGVSFILVTVNPDKLLVTVRSRCVQLRSRGSEENADADIKKLCDEYISLALGGSRAGLMLWCSENEKLDSKKLSELLDCISSVLTDMLRYSDSKKRIMDIIELIDRCRLYQSVNTGVKHIFGLLAVCSLPARETRKKVD